MGGAQMLVTGITANNVDFFEMRDQYTPIVFTFVLGLSFMLLMIVFRSLVVAVKAILMNLLSVGAAYGLLVWVFQEGHLTDFFGFQQVDADRGVDSALPLLGPVRSEHGLPRLPAQPDPGALRPDPQQPGVGRGRIAVDGPDHHRRGVDHGRRLRRLRERRDLLHAADGLRSRRRRAARRDDRALRSSCRRRWPCSATATGICRRGSAGCPTSGSKLPKSQSRQLGFPSPHRRTNQQRLPDRTSTRTAPDMGAVRFCAVVLRGSADGDGMKGRPTGVEAHGMRPRPRMLIRVIAETPFNDLGHGGRKCWAHAMRPCSVLTFAAYDSAITTKAAHGANTAGTRNDSYNAAASFGSG